MANKFKPGDIVKLKSGGPAMTISDYTGNDFVKCKWFAGAKSESDIFKEDMLVPFDAAAEKKVTSTAAEVALWMKAQLDADGTLYQDVAATGIADKFGESFVTVNLRNGNLNINGDVLAEFKKLTGEDVVWERGQRYWRSRADYDSPGRLQR